jgi:hypothetical protein
MLFLFFLSVGLAVATLKQSSQRKAETQFLRRTAVAQNHPYSSEIRFD